MKRDRSSGHPSGFTLLEVMMGLAILGLALTVLIKRTSGNIATAQSSHMMGVATELARAKMYDIEEQLLKDGFNETGLSKPGDECTDFEKFEDEGWPQIEWCAQIEAPQLPSLDKLQELTTAQAQGSGSAAGSAAAFAAGSAAAM